MRLSARTTLVETLDTALEQVRPGLDKSLEAAIKSVVWPPGSSEFTIYAESGLKRGKGNGVGPIKKEFAKTLSDDGWTTERSLVFSDGTKIGRFDAVRPLPGAKLEPIGKRTLAVRTGNVAVVEWETGNISSSHRSLNRMAMGLLHGGISAAFLVLPTRRLYRYLTGRIGSLEELAPYFGVYRALRITRGLLEVLAVEYDKLSTDVRSVPRIPKATDGRAQV